VEKQVIASMSQIIVSGMRGSYTFLKSKPALKAQILLDIGDEFL